VVAVVEVEAECEQAALAGAASVEVQCAQAALVALACAQLALTGVRLQVAGLRELTSAGPGARISVCLADLATGRAGVGVAEAGAAETGAGVEAGADGVGAPPR